MVVEIGTQIAQIAAVVWVLTEVIKLSPWCNRLAAEQIALILGIAVGVLGVLTGYLVGAPMDVVIQVVLAVVAAGVAHDKIIAPVSDGRL